MACDDLTAQRLRELLHYDPDTGVFVRLAKTSNNAKIGLVGQLMKRGNISVCILGKKRMAHRLAWLYVHGEWPTHEIDHIDGDPTNNRLSNLREATSQQNKQNQRGPRSDNTSGYLGVIAHGARWRAHIQHAGKSIHLGMFDSASEAHDAYLAAKRRLHPFGTL